MKSKKQCLKKKTLGISEHHRTIFSNRNDGFIKNEEAYIEFWKCLAFENNRHFVILRFKYH